MVDMNQKIDRIQALHTILCTLYPTRRDVFDHVLLSKPIPGVVGELIRGSGDALPDGLTTIKLFSMLKKVWYQFPKATRELYHKNALVCIEYADQELTIADVWESFIENSNELIEENLPWIRKTITKTAIQRVDKRLYLDSDVLDSDSLIAEAVADAKAVLDGSYQMPFEWETISKAWESFEDVIQGKEALHKDLGVYLGNLIESVVFGGEDDQQEAMRNFVCYMLARRIEREYHHTKARERLQNSSMNVDVDLDHVHADPFDDLVEKVDAQQLLNTLRDRLPPMQRTILDSELERVRDSLSIEEIASKRGMKPSTYKSNWRHIRNRFKQYR